jgi:hypothetical protein
MFSVLFLFVWNIMIARRLSQLANNTAKENANQPDIDLLTVPALRAEK